MASLQDVAVDPLLRERPSPRLRANFKWTLAGNLIYSICQWAMLTVLAKAGNATTVGLFALGLAISSPVFMLTNLQLRGVQVTDARKEYRFADYFTLRMLSTAVGLLVVAVMLLALHYDNATRGVIFFVALSKSIECFSDVIGGLLQFHERLDQAAISLMIRGVLSILLFGGTFLWSHSLIACTAAMSFAWLIVLIGYDLPRARGVLAFRESFFHFEWHVARGLIVLSLPLGLVMMLLSLNANIPRYFLEHYGGPAELGIFASLAYLLLAMSTVVNALGQSVLVRLSTMFAERDLEGFKKLIFKLVAMALAMTVVGLPLAALFGPALLTLLYRPEYAHRMTAFLIIVGAGGANAVGVFLGCGITAARYFRAQVPLTAACTLTVLAAAALLVPRYGSMGAALGLLASNIVLVFGCTLVLQKAIQSARKEQIEPR